MPNDTDSASVRLGIDNFDETIDKKCTGKVEKDLGAQPSPLACMFACKADALCTGATYTSSR